MLQALTSLDQNKNRHADREQGIQPIEIGKAHDHSTDQHHDPAKHVLQHMQIDRFLVERVSVVRQKCCEQIDQNADDGEQDHAVVMDLCRIKQLVHRACDHDQRTDQQHARGDQSTQNRVADVPVGIGLVRLFLAFSLSLVIRLSYLFFRVK